MPLVEIALLDQPLAETIPAPAVVEKNTKSVVERIKIRKRVLVRLEQKLLRLVQRRPGHISLLSTYQKLRFRSADFAPSGSYVKPTSDARFVIARWVKINRTCEKIK